MKKYLFGLLAITMVVGFSAFTTEKSAKKPFANVTYYYKAGVIFQRLEPNVTGVPNIEKSITQSYFTDADLNDKWSTTVVNFTSTSDMSLYIGSVSFDEEATADGGSDGQLTLQEALSAVWAAYVSPAPNPFLMPSSVTVNGSAVVTIVAKTVAI